MSRSLRFQFDIRADLDEQFKATARRRGHVRTDLVHAWMVRATRAALAGQDHLLPPAETARGFLGAGTATCRYTPPRDEWERCRTALAAAGSSARAVVEHNIRAYLAADGDWLLMVECGDPNWSPVGIAAGQPA
jgi:hypothetical protein